MVPCLNWLAAWPLHCLQDIPQSLMLPILLHGSEHQGPRCLLMACRPAALLTSARMCVRARNPQPQTQHTTLPQSVGRKSQSDRLKSHILPGPTLILPIPVVQCCCNAIGGHLEDATSKPCMYVSAPCCHLSMTLKPGKQCYKVFMGVNGSS